MTPTACCTNPDILAAVPLDQGPNALHPTLIERDGHLPRCRTSDHTDGKVTVGRPRRFDGDEAYRRSVRRVDDAAAEHDT